MTQRAFGGDASLKAALLDRIDAHVAGGTLVRRPVWEAGRGTPLGVSIEGSDPALYAERFGYPLALAAALDDLACGFDDVDERQRYAREWVSTVVPGALLADVPRLLIASVLGAIEAGGAIAALRDQIVARHAAQATGDDVPNSDWAELRKRIDATRPEVGKGYQGAALTLLETACWPARKGRSIVSSLIAEARRFVAYIPAQGWSDELEARAHAIMREIYEATQSERARGESVSIPDLFREREPELSRGFESNLLQANARSIGRGRELAWACVTLMGDAPLS